MERAGEPGPEAGSGGEEAAKGQEQMRAALWPQKMEMEMEGVKE